MKKGLLSNKVLVDGGWVSAAKRHEKLHAPATHLDPTRLRGCETAVRAAVMAIPNDFSNWDFWKRIGMLIFVASGGAIWGKELFIEWSQSNQTITEHTYTPEKAWQEMVISPPSRNGGANSLYTKARMDHGWMGDWEFPNEPK